jgi:hypothetical protein
MPPKRFSVFEQHKGGDTLNAIRLCYSRILIYIYFKNGSSIAHTTSKVPLKQAASFDKGRTTWRKNLLKQVYRCR